MKKAKLMLSAIAVFAVVGGAYAVKTAKRGAVIYQSTQAGSNVCTSTLLNYTTARAGAAITGSFAPTPGACLTNRAYQLN